MLAAGADAADISMMNPIGKVARIFNPQLVKMEYRVEFLNRRLMSLAVHKEVSLKYGMGARCAKFQSTDPDPSLTLDLGGEFPIESLFLVPLQMEAGDGGSLFPRGFRIDVSTSEACPHLLERA